MELAQILSALWARKLLTLLVVVVATGAAGAIKVSKHSVPTGTATVQILVDSPHSAIADLRQDPTPLTARASVIAQLMSSALMEQKIAAAAGIPAAALTTEGPFSGPGLPLDVVTPSEARGPQLAAEKVLYRLTFVPQQQLPIITVSAQAPTPAAAAKLAGAVYPAVIEYILSLQTESLTAAPPKSSQPTPTGAHGGSSASSGSRIPLKYRVTLRQLGPVQAGTENSGSVMILMVAAFLGLIVVGFLILVGLEALRPKRARAKTRWAETLEPDVELPGPPAIHPARQPANALAAARSGAANDGAAEDSDDASSESRTSWRARAGF